MSLATKPLFDTEEACVRFMRDQIYYRFDPSREHFCSDANWNACKDRWRNIKRNQNEIP